MNINNIDRIANTASADVCNRVTMLNDCFSVEIVCFACLTTHSPAMMLNT